MFTDTETVSAIDAAKRQLKEAITLFFEQRDSVSIHTLASASHEILCKFAKNKGVESFIRNPKYAKNDKVWEEYRKWLKKWKNFFKHAEIKEGCVEFPSELNTYIIHDCCHLYHQLIQETFWETEVWVRWVGLKHPDFIKDGPFKTKVINEIPSSVDPDDFEYFSDYLKEGNIRGM